MSKRNIFAGLALAAAFMAAPAFADGKDGVRINKGPAPLKGQICQTGNGYYNKDGQFVCPTTGGTTTRTYVTKPTTTRTYTRQPTTTRVVRSAPVQRVAAPAAPTVTLTGLTGGVGANVGTGFFGGGGGFIIESRAPFSGVLSNPAAALTFNQRRKRGGGHGPARPMPGCGC